MEIHVIELPVPYFPSEEGLLDAIVADPSMLGEGIRVLSRQYHVGVHSAGRVDLLCKKGEKFLLVEAKYKSYPDPKLVGVATRQLLEYRRLFLKQAEIFGARPEVEMMAVIGIAHLNEERRYILDVETGRKENEEPQWSYISELRSKIEEEVREIIVRDAQKEASRMIKEAEKTVAELKEQASSLKGEINRLKRVRSFIKHEYANRVLYQLPHFSFRRRDRDKCFLCGKASEIIIKAGRKDYGLCKSCFDRVLRLEEEALFQD